MQPGYTNIIHIDLQFYAMELKREGDKKETRRKYLCDKKCKR